MVHVRQHLLHEFLFAYLFFFLIPDTGIVIFCLLHYSCLSVFFIWHTIEQCKFYVSIGQWRV